jgi:hypothetical protein
MKKILASLLSAVLSAGCCSTDSTPKTHSFSIANPVLRQELLTRVEEDQAIAREYYPKQAAGQLDAALIARRESSLSNNTTRIKAIIKQYGWPGPDLVGKDGSDAAFLLVQHSDNSFRKKMLPAVRSAFKAHKLSGQNYALLLDINLVEEGKPQIYGTRVKAFDQWKNHKPIPEPIKDPANVDKRRAEVGLLPLSIYLDDMAEMRFPTQQTVSFSDKIKQIPGGDLMLSAIDFLVDLKKQNKLPGVGKDEHGTFPLSGFTKPESFPVRRTETFTKNDGDPSAYYYTVEKKAPDRNWQLKSAVRRDASGKIAGRYCVRGSGT